MQATLPLKAPRAKGRAMKLLAFLSIVSFLVPVLAASSDASRNTLRHREDAGFETELDAELDYTPAEVKRNALLRKLGLPTEPPKAKRAGEIGDIRPFDSSRGSDLFASRGYIGVHKESISGPLLGFLDGHRTVDTKENATLYAFIVNGPVMEIGVVGTQQRLSVAAGPFGVDLSPYSKNFHLPRHTLYSSIPGAGPNHDKIQGLLFETSVFSLDPDGDQIEVQWVNRNGQYTQTEIAIVDKRLYFTGDLQAFSEFTNKRVDHAELKWYSVAEFGDR